VKLHLPLHSTRAHSTAARMYRHTTAHLQGITQQRHAARRRPDCRRRFRRRLGAAEGDEGPASVGVSEGDVGGAGAEPLQLLAGRRARRVVGDAAYEEHAAWHCGRLPLDAFWFGVGVLACSGCCFLMLRCGGGGRPTPRNKSNCCCDVERINTTVNA